MQMRGVLSPSFSSYSNNKLTEVTARVVEELRAEENSEDFDGEFHPPQNREKSASPNDQQEEYNSRIEEKEDGDSEDDNEDFEFAFLTRESQTSSPISADEIFCNGQIRPVFPIFERDLWLRNMNLKRENQSEKGTENSGSSKGTSRTVRLPLRKLFIEERETASSDSSSEADELDGVPPETYCVWRRNASAEAAGPCNKSNSTGSSKRWRFRDLMNRSHSDGGKHTFARLTPTNRGKQKENEKIKNTKVTPVGGGKVKTAEPEPEPVAVAAQYVKNGGGRRRSYLPYKQDLLGFFSNVNDLSRNLQPF